MCTLILILKYIWLQHAKSAINWSGVQTFPDCMDCWCIVDQLHWSVWICPGHGNYLTNHKYECDHGAHIIKLEHYCSHRHLWWWLPVIGAMYSSLLQLVKLWSVDSHQFHLVLFLTMFTPLLTCLYVMCMIWSSQMVNGNHHNGRITLACFRFSSKCSTKWA